MQTVNCYKQQTQSLSILLMVAEMPPYTTHDKFLVSLVSFSQLVLHKTLKEKEKMQEDHIFELSIFACTVRYGRRLTLSWSR